MGERIADRIRLEIFRWTRWNTAVVIVAAAVGVLAGTLWGRG
jgi:hypothetical protein